MIARLQPFTGEELQCLYAALTAIDLEPDPQQALITEIGIELEGRGFTPGEETTALVNELIPRSTAIGAYAMGAACVACHQRGVRPSRALLVGLHRAELLPSAMGYLDEWLAGRRHKEEPC